MSDLAEVELQHVCTRISVGLAMAVTPYMTRTGVKLIRNQNIKPNKFDDSSIVHIRSDFAASHASKTIRRGDVVIVRTGANIGDACVVPENFDGAQSFTTLVVRADQKRLCPRYLAQFINSSLGRSEVERLMAGGGKGNLNSGELERFRITLLSIQEQKRVASLLKDWDTSIEITEQLLAAKELANKGLMGVVFRQNASPPRRLSEFTHRLTRKNVGGEGHPLTISGSEGLVSQSRYFGKRIAAEKTEHYTLLQRGEFAYNKSYSAGYPLGAIKRLDGHDEGIVSTLYLCFALNEDDAPMSDYFAYFCESGGFNHQIYQVAQEGARNHGLLNVTAEDFFSMAMPVPPREIQQRMVCALDAASGELALLREKLVALRYQKRGLMQKLLTGQWRLPESAEAAV